VCSLRDIPAVSRQPAGPAQVCSGSGLKRGGAAVDDTRDTTAPDKPFEGGGGKERERESKKGGERAEDEQLAAQNCKNMSDKSFLARQEEFTRLIEWNLSQTGAQACRVNRVRDSDAHLMQEAHKGAGDMPAMRPAKGDNAFLERVQERKEQVVLILSYTRTHARTYTYLASPATNMP
jgi:hypothetical protein